MLRGKRTSRSWLIRHGALARNLQAYAICCESIASLAIDIEPGDSARTAPTSTAESFAGVRVWRAVVRKICATTFGRSRPTRDGICTSTARESRPDRIASLDRRSSLEKMYSLCNQPARLSLPVLRQYSSLHMKTARPTEPPRAATNRHLLL